MKIEVVPALQLGADRTRAWQDLLRTSDTFDSPFFRPEYVQTVASVRNSIDVAVISKDDAVQGIFPFERRWGRWARPVGTPLNDIHGVIAPPQLAIQPHVILRQCGLLSWSYSHMPKELAAFHSFHQTRVTAPFILVAPGQRGDAATIGNASRHAIGKVNYYARRLTRELGPLRFQWNTDDDGVFATLMKWKSGQYQRSGMADLFAQPWIVALLERIRCTRTTTFGGVLSSMHAGNTLVAAHFGIRAGHVLHYWFPAYAASLARHSPGLVCLRETTRAASQHGIARIDLGPGDEPYKRRFMSGEKTMAGGHVSSNIVVHALARSRTHVRNLQHRSVCGAPIRAAARITRSARQQWSLR